MRVFVVFFPGERGVEKYTSLSVIEHIPWIFLDVLCISLIGEYVRSMLDQNQLSQKSHTISV